LRAAPFRLHRGTNRHWLRRSLQYRRQGRREDDHANHYRCAGRTCEASTDKATRASELRDLFITCRLPEESAEWVSAISKTKVTKPPYKAIIETVEQLQKKYNKLAVKYSMLMVELSHRELPIEYDTEEALIDLCKAMAQMAPGAMFAGFTTVELDQSTANVMSAIDAATKEYEESK